MVDELSIRRRTGFGDQIGITCVAIEFSRTKGPRSVATLLAMVNKLPPVCLRRGSRYPLFFLGKANQFVKHPGFG
jgi:hypothetical protein